MLDVEFTSLIVGVSEFAAGDCRELFAADWRWRVGREWMGCFIASLLN